MTYATVDHLKAAIPARDLVLLTDRTGAADSVDDTALASALDDASAEINGYIAKRVTLPLAAPPQMLRVVCRDLAVYRLYANAGRTTETQEGLRRGALAYLKQVAEGTLSLGDETGGAEELVSPGVVIDEGPDRVMTRDTLKGF